MVLDGIVTKDYWTEVLKGQITPKPEYLQIAFRNATINIGRRSLKMKDKIAKLIDVKSLTTLGLVGTMIAIVLRGRQMDEKVFLLFSNCTTMIVTYFFTKKPAADQ